jgi:stage II sporulation protein D
VQRWTTVSLLALLVGGLAEPCAAAQQSGVASVLIDLRTGTPVAVEQSAVIERAILPGSVMKIATIAAALEAGVITNRTGIVCAHTVVVDGHRLTCTHPDLHRPLTPAEALAQSCNTYVATVAARLPRGAFDRTLASLGLPPSDGTRSVAVSALGLEGQRVTPRALVNAVARIAGPDASTGLTPATLAVLRDGLTGAVRGGTAAAIGAAGIDALAKTGTVDAGGVSQGLVVGVTPSSHPTLGFALLASGGAGRDASALVVERLRTHLASPAAPVPRSVGATEQAVAPVVRVGVTRSDGTRSITTLALDEYVAGVTAGEAAPASGEAALDALAIAARTYALANRGRHASEGFDLCDLTHCQVLRRASPASARAARRTSGRYLADHGQPANVFYTASCGGYTERPSHVWRGAADPSFLPSRVDPACAGQPAWQSELSARDLLRALHAGGFKGDTIRGLAVQERTASGRVAWLHLDGVIPADVSGENLRTLVGRTLGWQHVRSTLFDVSRTSGGFSFRGRGAGHGVGLCVLGAAERARSGASAESILSAYFPGLALATLPAPAPTRADLRIVVPTEDVAQHADVERLVRRVLGDVRTTLDAGEPGPLTVRFHPTVESYQRATGQPWFTAGATHNGTIDLLPLAVLRQRGLLESTLRHEFTHALTSAWLQGAPRWMSEGVAEWVVRGGDVGASSRAAAHAADVRCPDDEEFVRGDSAAALRAVYERAGVCYAREVRLGRSWRTWRRTP